MCCSVHFERKMQLCKNDSHYKQLLCCSDRSSVSDFLSAHSATYSAISTRDFFNCDNVFSTIRRSKSENDLNLMNEFYSDDDPNNFAIGKSQDTSIDELNLDLSWLSIQSKSDENTKQCSAYECTPNLFSVHSKQAFHEWLDAKKFVFSQFFFLTKMKFNVYYIKCN